MPAAADCSGLLARPLRRPCHSLAALPSHAGVLAGPAFAIVTCACAFIVVAGFLLSILEVILTSQNSWSHRNFFDFSASAIFLANLVNVGHQTRQTDGWTYLEIRKRESGGGFAPKHGLFERLANRYLV